MLCLVLVMASLSCRGAELMALLQLSELTASPGTALCCLFLWASLEFDKRLPCCLVLMQELRPRLPTGGGSRFLFLGLSASWLGSRSAVLVALLPLSRITAGRGEKGLLAPAVGKLGGAQKAAMLAGSHALGCGTSSTMSCQANHLYCFPQHQC